MFFVHIPKCGGMFISNTLKCRVQHKPITLQHTHPYIVCLRHPLETFISFYFYLKQRRNRFRLSVVAKKNTLNEFIQILMNAPRLNAEQLQLQPIHQYSSTDYGMYTHYLLHLANPYNHTSIENVIDVIERDFLILRFETLETDLQTHFPTHRLPSKKINASKWDLTERITQETFDLVKEKERVVLERLFPHILSMSLDELNTSLFEKNEF